MPNDPMLRAGDTDREDVVARLREHYAAGRLTSTEFDERSDQAYQARTLGDLAALTTDLPYAPLEPVRPAAVDPSAATPPDPAGQRHVELTGWSSWLATALVLSAIWLISSIGSHQLQYFWPAWVIGPMGAVLVARTITGRRKPPRS